MSKMSNIICTENSICETECVGSDCVPREKEFKTQKPGPGGGGLNQRDVLFVVCTAVRLLYDSYDVDVPHLQSWSMLSPCALESCAVSLSVCGSSPLCAVATPPT